MQTRTYETHKYAELFPEMANDQFEELVKDVRQNGLVEPITTLEGKVLDGRCRLRACIEAGVGPRFVDFDGRQDPLMFVWAKNFARRHLEPGQRVAAALRLKDMVAAAAKERMRKGGTISAAVRRGDEGAERIPEDEKGRTVDKLAELAHVGRGTMQAGLEVERDAPELVADMAAGKVSVNGAARKVKEKKSPDDPLKRKGYWKKVKSYAEKLNGQLSLLDLSGVADLEAVETLIELADRIRSLAEKFYKGNGE